MNRTILACLLSLIAFSATAQKADSTVMKIADVVTIHSNTLHEDRKVYIYAPYLNDNPAGPKTPCPVLYMLDAEYQLTMTAGLVDYLSKAQALMPGMIIVGIDNNHYDRERDLTPTHSDKADPNSQPDTSTTAFTKHSGGGESFLRFIHEEVMPYVEQHYPTQPFKVFAGHSLGGLLVVHCLVEHPEMFNAYIAISPSLWWDDEHLIKNAAQKLSPGRLNHKLLFCSISGEGGQFYSDLQTFHGLLQAHASSGLLFEYQYYPKETHGSGPARALYDAFRFLYPNWIDYQDTTAVAIASFYQRLSGRYGYTIQPDENLLINKGYELLNDPKKADEAIALFKLAVNIYPQSYNTHDSLGDAYAKKGDKQQAIQCFREALKLKPDFKDSRDKLNQLLK